MSEIRTEPTQPRWQGAMQHVEVCQFDGTAEMAAELILEIAQRGQRAEFKLSQSTYDPERMKGNALWVVAPYSHDVGTLMFTGDYLVRSSEGYFVVSKKAFETHFFLEFAADLGGLPYTEPSQPPKAAYLFERNH